MQVYVGEQTGTYFCRHRAPVPPAVRPARYNEVVEVPGSDPTVPTRQSFVLQREAEEAGLVSSAFSFAT